MKRPTSKVSDPGKPILSKLPNLRNLGNVLSETFRRKAHLRDGVLETRCELRNVVRKICEPRSRCAWGSPGLELPSIFANRKSEGRIVKDMEPIPELGTGGGINAIQILQGSLGHRSAQPHHCFRLRVAFFVGRSHNIQGQRGGGRLRVDCKPDCRLWEKRRCLGLESWIRRELGISFVRCRVQATPRRGRRKSSD